MNGVNKTLYIPLYGKAYVSRKGIILQDRKAEEIWQAEGFPLKGKAKSRWLAYYMAMRARVFDQWTKQQLQYNPDAVVLHIGCGMDSRVLRVKEQAAAWFDVDFAEVIEERKRYFREGNGYAMLAGDARQTSWLEALPDGKDAVVVLEGISMYLTQEERRQLTQALCCKFRSVLVMEDFYTGLAVKMSRMKNPVHAVGVGQVHGMDDPNEEIRGTGMGYFKQHDMTPDVLVNELQGLERMLFRKLYAGKLSDKLYRIYEFQKGRD